MAGELDPLLPTAAMLGSPSVERVLENALMLATGQGKLLFALTISVSLPYQLSGSQDAHIILSLLQLWIVEGQGYLLMDGCSSQPLLSVLWLDILVTSLTEWRERE